MRHDEFKIGLEFLMGDGRWRCTDIGTRTIEAIRVDGVEIVRFNPETGESTTRVLDQAEAEREGWFNGPPYHGVEHVIDEDDMEDCTPAVVLER
jgi:hypothetical protein